MNPALLGIRREDKSRWEARVPLTPEEIARLIGEERLQFQVQTSPIRRFQDDAFRAAGAEVVDELAEAPIILGVKEIPAQLLEADKTYLFFSHTIKAQPANMPMLRRIVELGATLIDYERITDEAGRRLVFFGRYAGLAGMIDALWALGQRLRYEGVSNPFTLVKRAYEYENLEHARKEIARVGQQIRKEGLPECIRPLMCGFAGYGNVSQGAQEIYDLLPVQFITPGELASFDKAEEPCVKVVFREEHLVEPLDEHAEFELQEYYQHPEKYRAAFQPQLERLHMLINCIYWEPKYPRLVTCEQVRQLFGGGSKPRLRVIGDITCDIEGSIECTVRPTEPGEPVYVYEPAENKVRDGVEGNGPVILAVDILPCELPIDASTHFSRALSPFLPALATANFDASLDESGLPPELRRATIVYRGRLTEPYRYLEAEIQ